MLRYLTVKEMRETEKAAFDRGVPPLLPMEKAAEGLKDALKARCPGGRVLFVCGSGNNGADGLAAARLWALDGGGAEAVLVGSRFTAENLLQRRYLDYLGVPCRTDWESVDFTRCDAVVDALFGIGLDRPLREPYPEIIGRINEAPFRIAADIPSGLNADTGLPMGAAVKADVTVTFHAPKTGLALTPLADHVGLLRVRDVGFFHDEKGIPAYEEGDWEALRHRRPAQAHKASCGRVLVMGGDPGMCGAAAMCALGALRAGAGLVTIACEGASLPILQALVPNAMCVPLDKTESLPAFDVLAAGCGLRLNPDKERILMDLIGRARRYVLDAGALPLAEKAGRAHPGKGVVTPHPGEAAALLGLKAADITDDPVGSARALNEKTGAAAVLKSARTVIFDGRRTAFNTVGTPALAKGGSGDALCGILSATLCVNPDPFEAARISCLRMGMAGLRAERIHGTDGLLTGEMLACLP